MKLFFFLNKIINDLNFFDCFKNLKDSKIKMSELKSFAIGYSVYHVTFFLFKIIRFFNNYFLISLNSQEHL